MTQIIFEDMLREQEPNFPQIPGEDHIVHHTPSEKLVGNLALRFQKVADAVPPAVEKRFTQGRPLISGDFLGRQPNSLL